MKKVLSLVFCLALLVMAFAACTPDQEHEHTFDTQLSWDSDFHWYAATCEHSEEVSGKEAHMDEDKNDLCDVCSYAMNHVHTFEKTWVYDESKHWHAANCGHQVKDAEAAHADANNDGACDVCSYVPDVKYQVNIKLPDYVQLLDANGLAAEAPFTVKEGSQLSFKLVMPEYANFGGVPGADVSEPVKEGGNLIYTVTLKVTADVELEPAISIMSAYEMIVKAGSAVIETSDFMPSKIQIAFTAAAPGRYAIYAIDDEQVQFGSAEGTDRAKVYVFDVAEAGEVLIRAQRYGSNPGVKQHNITYNILKLEEKVTLPGLEGSGYLLPTVAPVDVYVTLPKAGLYQISTSWDSLAWNDDVSKPYYINTTEDNQTVKLEARFDIYNYPVSVTEYVLDWKIKLVAPETEVKLGANKLTVPFGEQYGFSFTADVTGTYDFDSGSDYVRFNILNEFNRFAPQGTTYSVQMQAGETIELYLDINVYAMPSDMPREDVETTVTVSCTPDETQPHVHSFASTWSYDATGHWYAATCEHKSEKKDYAEHSFDAKGLCTCGYEHVHTFDVLWSTDKDNHWYASTCGHEANKDFGKHEYDAKGVCVCGYEHEHSYADKWSSDDSNHWKDVTCGHQADKGQLGAHADADKDGKCDVCAKEVSHFHSFDTSKWVSDDNYHWHASTCGHDDVDAKAAHDYDAKGICKTCKAEHKHTYADQWSVDENNHWHVSDCGHGAANHNSAKHTYDAKGVCTVCKYEHVHTFATEWSKDASGHWKPSTCNHGVAVEKIEHTYDKKGVCTTCKYEHEHTFSTEWSYDDNTHYYAPTCGHEAPNQGTAKHVLNNKGVCTVCGFEHKHQYAETWSTDDKYHWHAVRCGCEIEPEGKDTHVDANSDGKCDTCNYVMCDHKYSTTYSYDDDGHWRVPTCGCNVGISDVGEHVNKDSDAYCDVCKYEVGIIDPVRESLIGEHSVNYLGVDFYSITIRFNSKASMEGTITVIDNLATNNAPVEYTFVYDSTTVSSNGLKIMKDGAVIKAFTIKRSADGQWIFSDGSMVNNVPMKLLRPPMDKVWEDTVTITVEGGYSPAKKITFTAPFTGSFVLRPGAGTSNISVYDYKNNGINVPYEFSLEKGETISFSVATNSTKAGEYKLLMYVMGVEGEYIPPDNMLLIGVDKEIVIDSNSTGGEEMLFKAKQDGTYKITFVNDDFGCFNKYNVFPLTAYGDGNSITVALKAGEFLDFLAGVDDPVNNSKYGVPSNPYTITLRAERIGDYDEEYAYEPVEDWTEEDFDIPRAIVKGKKDEE